MARCRICKQQVPPGVALSAPNLLFLLPFSSPPSPSSSPSLRSPLLSSLFLFPPVPLTPLHNSTLPSLRLRSLPLLSPRHHPLLPSFAVVTAAAVVILFPHRCPRLHSTAQSNSFFALFVDSLPSPILLLLSLSCCWGVCLSPLFVLSTSRTSSLLYISKKFRPLPSKESVVFCSPPVFILAHIATHIPLLQVGVFNYYYYFHPWSHQLCAPAISRLPFLPYKDFNRLTKGSDSTTIWSS